MNKVYIINQAALKTVPYGCRNSDYNGCGWIALFNLMNRLGVETGSPETFASREDVQKCVLCKGLLGTNPLKLKRFLKHNRIDVNISINTYKSAVRRTTHSDCGIIMYFHQHGAHFVMYDVKSGETFHFFNAIYGKTDHFENINEFITKRCHFGVIILLTHETKR